MEWEIFLGISRLGSVNLLWRVEGGQNLGKHFGFHIDTTRLFELIASDYLSSLFLDADSKLSPIYHRVASI